ncbi:Cytochrome P450 monooxygenase lolP1 [Colletotrichum spinosum]|uniref:Cytochrome P450 monooxygenase lolP1 n=1 Tax=Colletotrichum spinosum TaxID=1347390 RepID=A0A4R8QNB9_9PEZI|nr:Cytochrome P450 monooxygenase lolP1 [Colletotrichum spinosum]
MAIVSFSGLTTDLSRDYAVYLTITLVALVIYHIGSVFRQYARLRHITGPRTAGFSKLWLIRTIYSGRGHLKFFEAYKKYGTLVRVGPNDIMTCDPDLMKRMLGVRTSYTRSKWYDAMRLDPGKDNVLSMRDNEAHNKLRSQMAAGYTGKEVDSMEAKIDENIVRYMDLIDKYIAKNEAFDFGRKTQYFTLDVISDLAFGTPFGDVSTDSDVHEYIHTMEQNMPNIVLTANMPWLLSLLSSPLFRGLLPSENDAIGVGKTIGIAKRIVAERFRADKTVKRDMLGSFIAHGLTQEEASSEILMQILAGSDTTATAIRGTFLHIMTSPRVTSKLLAEIKATQSTRPVVTEAEAKMMPYLQAVIKEGLRIFPPVVGQMTKEVPKGGDTFKGVHFPEGTRIGWGAWGIFHRTDLWGSDADVFRPERWLEADAEQLRLMEGTLELIFGYGKWQCLGRNVAMMELRKIFVEVSFLLQRFCMRAF